MHVHRLSALFLAAVISTLGPAETSVRAQSTPDGEAAPVLPPGAVATVNGNPIRRSAIDDRLWREWGPVYLDFAIRSQIVRQEAARRGITVTPDELKTRMGEYQVQFNSMPGRQPRDWELFIQRYGRESIEERQRDELLAEKIGEDDARKTTLTEEDKARVRADLERAAHKVHVRHILVGIGEEYGGRTEEQARARAEEVRAKLAAGLAWEQAVREYSDDISTREHSGDLGFFTREQMMKPLEDAAFAATPGDTIHVVRVPDGFDVFQVIAREDKTPTDAEIQAAQEETLKRKQAIARSPTGWFAKLQSQYDVVSAMPFERTETASSRPAGGSTGKPGAVSKKTPAARGTAPRVPGRR